ncbi:MAG: hypothetical protein AB7T10_08600 [bacterium]
MAETDRILLLLSIIVISSLDVTAREYFDYEITKSGNLITERILIRDIKSDHLKKRILNIQYDSIYINGEKVNDFNEMRIIDNAINDITIYYPDEQKGREKHLNKIRNEFIYKDNSKSDKKNALAKEILHSLFITSYLAILASQNKYIFAAITCFEVFMIWVVYL